MLRGLSPRLYCPNLWSAEAVGLGWYWKIVCVQFFSYKRKYCWDKVTSRGKTAERTQFIQCKRENKEKNVE